MIERHFVDAVDPDGTRRRVHYRRAGRGPAVLLLHQSPRSSEEWVPLIERWRGDCTLIAPDTPGFGQSGPLGVARPEVADYAAATLAFLDSIGVERVAAYGFHSGAIILMAAARAAPERFTGLACGGYAMWTEAERADFAAHYTPSFGPLAYGEHLAWLWGRLMEQSWFFPWYRQAAGTRLAGAHHDAARVHAIALECLAAGTGFATGYAAVLRATRELPAPGEATAPTLIAAYDGDPLAAHLARLGPLPAGWEARAVPDPPALEAAARAWLMARPAPLPPAPAGAADEGFAAVAEAGFCGLVHWRGAGRPWLHAPGSAASAAPPGVLAIDLPGHGLSSDWAEAPARLEAWAAVAAAALRALGADPAAAVGEGWSALLATRLGAAPAPLPPGDPARWRAEGLPDLTPDRAGTHLLRAWRMVRQAVLFAPWFEVARAAAREFAADELAPERLAVAHLALLRASAGQALLGACLDDAAALA